MLPLSTKTPSSVVLSWKAMAESRPPSLLLALQPMAGNGIHLVKPFPALVVRPTLDVVVFNGKVVTFQFVSSFALHCWKVYWYPWEANDSVSSWKIFSFLIMLSSSFLVPHVSQQTKKYLHSWADHGVALHAPIGWKNVTYAVSLWLVFNCSWKSRSSDDSSLTNQGLEVCLTSVFVPVVITCPRGKWRPVPYWLILSPWKSPIKFWLIKSLGNVIITVLVF